MAAAKEPGTGTAPAAPGPGVTTEQSFEGLQTVDVSLPPNTVEGVDFSKQPFPAGGVTITENVPTVDRAAALRALVSMPADRTKPVPPSATHLVLPGRQVRDYGNEDTTAQVYDVIATRFNAAMGGNAKAKELPRFIMCAAGDTVALTDVEAAWGLKCGAIRLAEQPAQTE